MKEKINTSDLTLLKANPKLAKRLREASMRDIKARKVVSWDNCHWKPEHLK